MEMCDCFYSTYWTADAQSSARVQCKKITLVCVFLPHVVLIFKRLYGAYWYCFASPKYWTWFDDACMLKTSPYQPNKIQTQTTIIPGPCSFIPNQKKLKFWDFNLSVSTSNHRTKQRLQTIPLCVHSAPLSHAIPSFIHRNSAYTQSYFQPNHPLSVTNTTYSQLHWKERTKQQQHVVYTVTYMLPEQQQHGVYTVTYMLLNFLCGQPSGKVWGL